MIKRDPSRFVQFGFLALLFLSVLLVGYWTTENILYMDTVETEIDALLGEGESRIAETSANIEAASEGRANRHIWEGGFFLVVLIGGMAVLTRTLRHDAELRRRQQNFLAAVSHEFKSPLASMQLAAETLVLRAREPDAKRLGQRILEDCERLLRMVDNLLDTTSIEEGRHRLKEESVALAQTVGNAADSFAERAERHDIAIDCSVPDGLSLSIDHNALDSILRNLIDNALKASIAGEGHRIEVSAEDSDGSLRLSVSDEGLGFPPEEASLMFEKFHRLGDELRRKTPGTGLGLYIVRRLAELSGGTVEARSEGPGRGATVSVSWPQGASE